MESRHSILPQTQTQSEKQSEHRKNLSSAKMKSTNFQITTFELEKLQIFLTFLASNVVLRLCPNYKHAPFIKRCCTKHQHIFALFINSAAHQILKYAIFFMSHACDLNVQSPTWIQCLYNILSPYSSPKKSRTTKKILHFCSDTCKTVQETVPQAMYKSCS